ncbi:MAG: hypothetical protein C0501_11635 [Isosphaera sp.]|nr:hypothetical protein [Isosphaera sp.]
MLWRAALALLTASTGLGLVAADPPAERKRDPEEAGRQFYGVWLQEEQTVGGKRTTDPSYLCGFLFGGDKWYAWDRRGESSAARADRGVRVDATADPMRFDMLDGTDGIRPGIFKFDGEKLIVALADWTKERKLGKGEDYPARPKEFNSTKDNGVQVYVLRRGKAMYDQD